MSKSINDILKCDICNNNFDLNSHRPLIVKCGHTFCKHCILSNKREKNNNSCPIDNQLYVLSIESCLNNLKLEEIIKNYFNLEEKKNSIQKQIIYIKPDIKRNKSPSLKHNNNRSNEKNINYDSNNIEKIRNLNNNNIEKKNLKKIENINNEIKDIKDELNDSIETIPLNEDKSVMNMSFKDEWTTLLNKGLIEKKLSKGEKEIIIGNNDNVEDTLDKISKIDDEFLTTSNAAIGNLIPNSVHIKNNFNNNKDNKNNNINNNNDYTNVFKSKNTYKKVNKDLIRKNSKETNCLKYSTNTYNSKNRFILEKKVNNSLDKNSKNINNYNSNNVLSINININNRIINNNNENYNNYSITPRKEENEILNKNDILLQTYNKIRSRPYHKTVIVNKSAQGKFNLSKNEDLRKESENIKNNRSQEELKNAETILKENSFKKEDKNKQYSLDQNKIIKSNNIKNSIQEIQIDINNNQEEKNKISKSYGENEDNNNMKINKISTQRRKNSDLNSNLIPIGKLAKTSRDFNYSNYQKSNIKSINISTPKNNINKDNFNIIYNSEDNKISKTNNLVIQNFENSINNTLDNSIIKKNLPKNEILQKLENELKRILMIQDENKEKKIEETLKYKKYKSYIEKSLENERLKNNEKNIKIKLTS